MRKAREVEADQSIHGYSTAPYRARRDSLEVAWGSVYTVVADNLAPHYIAQNANPHSTSHTYLGVADTRQNSEPNVITTPSYTYTNYFKPHTADDDQS
jgi:hypothetical protein